MSIKEIISLQSNGLKAVENRDDQTVLLALSTLHDVAGDTKMPPDVLGAADAARDIIREEFAKRLADDPVFANVA